MFKSLCYISELNSAIDECERFEKPAVLLNDLNLPNSRVFQLIVADKVNLVATDQCTVKDLLKLYPLWLKVNGTGYDILENAFMINVVKRLKELGRYEFDTLKCYVFKEDADRFKIQATLLNYSRFKIVIDECVTFKEAARFSRNFGEYFCKSLLANFTWNLKTFGNKNIAGFYNDEIQRFTMYEASFPLLMLVIVSDNDYKKVEGKIGNRRSAPTWLRIFLHAYEKNRDAAMEVFELYPDSHYSVWIQEWKEIEFSIETLLKRDGALPEGKDVYNDFPNVPWVLEELQHKNVFQYAYTLETPEERYDYYKKRIQKIARKKRNNQVFFCVLLLMLKYYFVG